jgi:Raf kinase inhibitor-like YbhB/YbcL family protein
MLALTSTAFVSGGAMPSRYTCDGEDLSPPLAWRGAPEGTRSFALLVDDPDAPDPKAPTRVWVHWVVYNVPASVASLAEGASPRSLPPGAREGRHDGGGGGWSGPCPPIGRHRYFHKLFALDAVLPDLGPGARRAELERAIDGHVLATAELIGTYERGGRARD